MSDSNLLKCDILVIGRGMAGMAAALFAANRGLSTVQVGMTGEIIFASGLLDLMGVYPIEEKKVWQDPWAAINSVVEDRPDHPYAHLTEKDIRASFVEVLSFLQKEGLTYCREESHNSRVINPLGKMKVTYCVPGSMWNGVKALSKKPHCLIAGFRGLNDFSARQIVETLQQSWPKLRAVQIPFPETDHVKELFTGDILAQALELSVNRKKLIESLGEHIKDAEVIGLPAVLGMHHTDEIIAELEEEIGLPVFEIPTPPVSVPGLRLNDAFVGGLSAKGVTHFPQSQIVKVRQEKAEEFVASIGPKPAQHTIVTKGIILASGRFWGRGLSADRHRIRETIFDLPVSQPENRDKWHADDLLESGGHPINQAGVETDHLFRPLDSSGKPLFPTLFAAGSILAHNDWVRMKCGSGVSIASAYGAVKAFIQLA
jgi:glycerol-3-phosphate dehydrogenase subunit B